MRRTVSRAPRAASCSRPRRSATASGSDRTSGRTAPSCMVRPASVGPDPVVQVPPQALALLLARHHQPVPAGPQCVGEQRGLDGHPAVPAEVGRAGRVPRCAAGRPGRDGDASRSGVAPETRSACASPRPRAAPPSCPRGRRPRPGPRHPQGRGDRRGQAGQDGVDAGRGVGLLGQPLQRPVGIAQVAVEQPVHQRGQPRAQRMDREGRAPGDDGDAEVGQVLPQQPEQRRDQDRETGDERGEHGVDEGLPRRRRPPCGGAVPGPSP